MGSEVINRNYIEFRSPIEILSDPPLTDGLLIGDSHLSKGSVCILGGAPGVGKSRMAMSLAIAGATQSDWFGYPVRRKFKTMILQSENGAWRLYNELRDIEGIEHLNEYIRISDPPNYGIRLDEIGFRKQFLEALDYFRPDVLVIDPWNAVVSDDKAKDFRVAFDTIRSLTGVSENDPALVVIHHTRKPKENERHSGRALLNLFAGSYVIGSVARSAFVMQSATNDPEDDRVVVTCCKNNDGELGERTAWHRRNGLFDPTQNFEWSNFDKEPESTIATAQDKVLAVLREGKSTRKQLVEDLKHRFGMGRSSVYAAIKSLIQDSLATEDLVGFIQLT